ncbi:TPA: type II toxin-antitoxin system HicB family antitoxin [Streptococcus pyogenes]|jgi:predicted RNase H-like HicB family nuclease|uniref:type II toxin-antitoxin system HicB family antitoxin n=1 Tax=Streptococcus TaxID=1301 RepID=UPI000E0186CC|nr:MULTISPECIES: type II toxin-antitoxin system HicB family antitoxin [Streptococcus]QQT04756.1 type II toxin-antitoxin system HicB family antitoxin [Streptococcus dysgalactiae]SUN43966.1 toxin-antitoxin system, antitoxin component, HicB family [Streptococcus dysgalactiae subsp. dysgalactiae]SUN43970.1 toxin-antitoxin system, antitoxin component, HicB family [Streptococcus dysgalactiae subsp. dysgalactiae]SUN69847.1 toxin-antitoxin system, antitoxin component, HicB family [Streptococcus dysgala
MLISYPAIFHKGNQGYWVEFPEFGGGTQGTSLEDAITNAQEMLEGIVISYANNNMILPNPSQLDDTAIADGFLKTIFVVL